MEKENSDLHQEHLDFVKSNFDELRDRAIEDLTRYTSGWAVYTIDFLNSVAEINGSARRLEAGVVSLVRNGHAHRFTEPHVARLLREAEDVWSVRIDELIGLLAAECSRIEDKQVKPASHS